MHILYVEHIHQTLTFSHHVLHEERHLGNFLPGLICTNKRVPIIWHDPLAIPHNRENCENRQDTMPQTARLQSGHGAKASAIAWDAVPLRPHQGQVDGHMAEGEGVGAGAFRAQFSDGVEGESRY